MTQAQHIKFYEDVPLPFAVKQRDRRFRQIFKARDNPSGKNSNELLEYIIRFL